MPVKLMSLLAAVIVWGAWSVAHADVPRAQDIATCNAEARETARKGKDARTASPTVKDHRRAAEARGQPSGDGTGAGTITSDPQLAGMDAEDAKNPAYQAAYRTCMRKAGF